jgi:glutamine phosphoribosylpyrophosphate amidotransferase
MLIPQEKCTFNIIYTYDVSHLIEGTPVKHFRTELAKSLAAQIMEKGLNVKYVIPIPNTGIVYAKEVAKHLNAKYMNPFVKKKISRTLGMNNRDRVSFYDRFLENMELGEDIGETIFIDEALISGTTISIMAEWARKKGISSYSFGFASPPIINYCPQQVVKNSRRLLDPATTDLSTDEAIKELNREIGSKDIFFVLSAEFSTILSGRTRCSLCFSQWHEIADEVL